MKLFACISCVSFLATIRATIAFSCMPLDSKLFGECVQAGYNVSVFKDNLTQSAILEFITNMHGMFKQCSSLSTLMTCSIHLPRCSAESERPTLPCMEVCRRFVEECNGNVTENGLMNAITRLCQLLPLHAANSSKCWIPHNFDNSQHYPEFDSTCKSLALNQCLHAGYSLTSISPGQQKMAERSAVFEDFQNKSSCSKLKKVVCMELAPPCNHSNNGALYVPCRALCQEAYKECPSRFIDILKDPSYCSTFPDSKSSDGMEYCVLDTWPSHGFWPSSMWTSLAMKDNNISSPTQSSEARTTYAKPTPRQNITLPTLPSGNGTKTVASTPSQSKTSPTQPSENETTSAEPPSFVTQHPGNKTTIAAQTSDDTKSSPDHSQNSGQNNTNPTLPNRNNTKTTPLTSSPTDTSPTSPPGNKTTITPVTSSPTDTSPSSPPGNKTTNTPFSSSPTDTSPSSPPGNKTTNTPLASSHSETSTSPPGNKTTTTPLTSSPTDTSPTPPPGNKTTTTPLTPSPTDSSPTSSTRNKTKTTPLTSSQTDTSPTPPPGNRTKTTPLTSSPTGTSPTPPPGNKTTITPLTSSQSETNPSLPPRNTTTTSPFTSSKTETNPSLPPRNTTATSPFTSSKTETNPTPPLRNNTPTANRKSSSPAVQGSNRTKISPGAITGIVLGIIAVMVVAAVAIVCFRRYNETRRQFRHSLMVDMDEL